MEKHINKHITRELLIRVECVILFGLLFSFVQAAVEKEPYLIYEGSNTAMTVLWQMTSRQQCTIEWGLDTNYSMGVANTSEYGLDSQHKYTINGLSPGTKYYYNVIGVGSGSFVTAPADTATAVNFIAYGDTRSYPGNNDSVTAQMINTYFSDPTFQALLLHVGDWVSGDTETYWASEWFSPAYANMLEFRRNVPINGCRGNHEGNGAIYKKYYPYTYVSAFYWSFDYGPAHVSVVDQYVSYDVGSPQYNWLQNDLATSNKEWKFILLHEPGWSAGGGHSNNTTVQNVIQPLCEMYGVRIVFCGHNHYYARCDVNGIQHVTVGGGGAPLAEPDYDSQYLVSAEAAYSFAEISLTGDTLMMTVRRNDGTVIDTYTYSEVIQTPTGLTATAGNAQVALSWMSLSAADSYNVYRGTTPGGPYSQITTDITVNDYVDDTVINGITYYYVITAVNTYGNESGYSNEESATPQAPVISVLTVNSSGVNDVVISSSTGHGGTTNYSTTVDEGTTVTLTAPATWGGATFTGWSGSVSSSSQSISFLMNSNNSVTANYETATTTTYSLYVYSSGTANVAISSSTGQGGTTVYSTTANEGTTVILTAPATWNGMTFSRWSGSVSSSSQTISLHMDGTKYVIAYYEHSATPTSYSLGVNSSGASSVEISSSTDHGGTTNYNKTVNEGTTVTLTAPATWGGATFTSWSGSVSSSSLTISLSMNANKSVNANYTTATPKSYSLYVYSSGTASVSIVSSSGQDGTTSYTKTVNEGTMVTLTAPETWNGMTFTGWTGSITSSSQTISFAMTGNKYVIAHYELTTPPTMYTLSVNSAGVSGVAISSSTGHGGTTNYAKTVNDGTTVTLTAPATSSRAIFTGWTGAVSSSSQTISLSMNGNKSVTANYETTIPLTHTLSVYSSGTTSVTISSSTGQGGTTNYTKIVNEDTTITLTAPAVSSGMVFDGWTGAVTSSSQTISLPMNADKSITANYTSSGCVSSTISVDSIVPGTQRGSRGQSFGYVTVTVIDNCGNPVADAIVTGIFTGDFNETLGAVTNAHGIALFTTTIEVKKPAYTFCVDGLDHAVLIYNSASNVQTCASY